MRTAWETASSLLFDEFLMQHHEALTEVQQELTDMLPTLQNEDFLHFQNLILRTRDDVLANKIPASSRMLATMTVTFKTQLESAYINYVY